MKLPARAQLIPTTALAILALAGCGRSEPAVHGLQPQLRLLTEEQYRNVIRDVFGPQIAIGGSLDPILREDALIATSAGHATVSPSGLERVASLGESVAGQVVDPSNRRLLISCEPERSDARDNTCARAFLGRVGKLLYRRPLTSNELQRAVALSGDAAERIADFYGGLAYGLTFMLVSPEFLFITDTLRPGSSPQLDGYSRAARLSFFLWNTTPDDALIDAATRGDLDDLRGLERESRRLLDSPRLEDGLRAMFADILQLDKFATLAKDPVIYPAFDQEVAQEAREQILRTITWHLLDENGDYRRLFDLRTTFMTGALGRIYRVAVPEATGWSRIDFPPEDLRGGIQTLVGFAALHSHPGRSSPTIRGRAVRELLLCQKVPDPPGDVDFSKFNAPNATNLPARQRLALHATNPTCAGCHKLTDTIGLGLENIDGAGQLRLRDGGVAVDASGVLDGRIYADIRGLREALAQHPAIPSCLVQHVAGYALAGTERQPNPEWRKWLVERFRSGGYRMRPLLGAIVRSPNFYAVDRPMLQTAALRAEASP